MTLHFHPVLVVWHLALILLLLGQVVRARSLVARLIAFDVLSIVFASLIALVCVRTGDPGYLDIALVVALLGFAQTVVTARLLRRRPDLE